MTWFKVDDALPTHRKVLSIPRGARRLAAVGAWTMGGAWCAGNLTEGRIPKPVLDDLGIAAKVAADLVAAGMWIDEQTHYVMHNYLDYNPTSAEVKRDRAAAAERQRRARERAREARESRDEQAPSPADTSDRHAVTNGVTHGEVTRPVRAQSHDTVTVPPTRPVPARPALVLDVDVEGSASTPTSTCSPASPSSALTLVNSGPRAEDLFAQWWSVYPRKKAKADALKAFKGALKHATFHELMQGADRLRNQPNRADEFTPYPASWLRAGQWADEPDTTTAPPSRGRSGDDAAREAHEAGLRVLARRASGQSALGRGSA